MKRHLAKDEDLILYNREVHDAIASDYDEAHKDIFNQTEQGRIREALESAISQIQTGSKEPHILDFGSGTGNLTKHLMDLQASVVAADVSVASLKQLENKIGKNDRLKTKIIDGKGLECFSDKSFDMVVTYSVLHHLPDYLGIIEEFQRVAKPGGVIYIDHERCPSYWHLNINYIRYLYAMRREMSLKYSIRRMVKMILGYSFVTRWKQMLTNRDGGALGEGDIHIFKDDHIEWDNIRTSLLSSCDILKERDYLLCSEMEEKPSIWLEFCQKCHDMRFIIARKKL